MKRLLIVFLLIYGNALAVSNCDDVWLTYGDTSPENSIVINWHTHHNGNSIVEYGLTSGLGTTDSTTDDMTRFHHVELTGLSKGTKYFYKARSNGIDTSSIRWFTTDDGDYITKILAMGDTQHHDTLQVTIDSLLARNHHLGIDLFLHVGDIIHDADDSLEWEINGLFPILDTLIGYIPFIPCMGNHETSGDSAVSAYKNYFQLPSNGTDEYWYSFNYSKIHFVSSSRIGNEDIYQDFWVYEDKTQWNWLVNDLRTNNSNWKIVFYHIPTVHARQWAINTDAYNISLDSLLWANDVRLVLNGHMHYHERDIYDNVMYISVGHSAHYSHTFASEGGGGHATYTTLFHSDQDDKLNGGKGYNILEVSKNTIINKAYDWSGAAHIDSCMIRRRANVSSSGVFKF